MEDLAVDVSFNDEEVDEGVEEAPGDIFADETAGVILAETAGPAVGTMVEVWLTGAGPEGPLMADAVATGSSDAASGDEPGRK